MKQKLGKSEINGEKIAALNAITKPKPTVNIESKKSRILIVGDNNALDCSIFLKRFLKPEEWSITTFSKPNALFEDIISELPLMCKDFDMSDHVLIFGGTTNALRGHPINSHSLSKCLDGLQNTSTTIVGTSYCKNRNILNNIMFDINSVLYKNSCLKENVNYLETNRFFSCENIINYKPFLNDFKKKVLLSAFCNNFLINPAIDYQCLINVSLCRSAEFVGLSDDSRVDVPVDGVETVVSEGVSTSLKDCSSIATPDNVCSNGSIIIIDDVETPTTSSPKQFFRADQEV